LTVGAEESGPLRLDQTPNDLATGQAGEPLATIDLVGLAIPTRLAIGTMKISQGAAPLINRLL
jgi:hypothetical protein